MIFEKLMRYLGSMKTKLTIPIISVYSHTHTHTPQIFNSIHCIFKNLDIVSYQYMMLTHFISVNTVHIKKQN